MRHMRTARRGIGGLAEKKAPCRKPQSAQIGKFYRAIAAFLLYALTLLATFPDALALVRRRPLYRMVNDNKYDQDNDNFRQFL